MDILHRFALIVHWFSFIVGVVFFSVLVYIAFFEAQEPTRGIIKELVLLFAPVIFIGCHGMGWLFRFVISGKIHFLPWKKLND
tara:strand:- start:316 stop:564 length:249 start_codon:yes stop_codon:yes gene_type:complete